MTAVCIATFAGLETHALATAGVVGWVLQFLLVLLRLCGLEFAGCMLGEFGGLGTHSSFMRCGGVVGGSRRSGKRRALSGRGSGWYWRGRRCSSLFCSAGAGAAGACKDYDAGCLY